MSTAPTPPSFDEALNAILAQAAGRTTSIDSSSNIVTLILFSIIYIIIIINMPFLYSCMYKCDHLRPDQNIVT